MIKESINCPTCNSQGWIEAVAINESAKKKIICGICGYKIKYKKKKWKPAVIK